jgi:hypothetical protein
MSAARRTSNHAAPTRRAAPTAGERGFSQAGILAIAPLSAGVVKLADARDSKSRGVYAP